MLTASQKQTQSCIPAGELSKARENLALLGSRLREVEELLKEIEQSGSEPSQPTEEHAAPPDAPKQDDRVFRRPSGMRASVSATSLPGGLAVPVALLPLSTETVSGVGPTISPGRKGLRPAPCPNSLPTRQTVSGLLAVRMSVRLTNDAESRRRSGRRGLMTIGTAEDETVDVEDHAGHRSVTNWKTGSRRNSK